MYSEEKNRVVKAGCQHPYRGEGAKRAAEQRWAECEAEKEASNSLGDPREDI